MNPTAPSKATRSSSHAERQRQVLALTALVLGALAMGASPIFVRLADVGPYASAFWRVFLALPFLAIWMATETRGALPKQCLAPSVWLSGLFFAGDLFFWHLAIFATTVANATFLATTAPIWVAIGAWFVLREIISGRIITGLVLCLLGGAALIGETYGFAPQRLVGDIFGLATAFFFGAYLLAIRAARAFMPAGTLAFLSTAVTTLILFAVALLLEPTLLPSSWRGAAALLALALISQVGGQGLLAVALGTLPATFSALVIFLEAIAAAGLAWIILGEALSILQLCGGLLILFGIWIARPRAAGPAL